MTPVSPSPQLVQNRVYLYRLLLLKIALFRDWVVELSREARGPCYVPTRQAPGEAPCALGQALRVGLALLLWGPRLAGEAGLRCARAPILALQCLGICEWLGLCVAAWRGVLWSCLHSLMLVALLSLLLAWRLFQRAQCFLGWLPRQVGGWSHWAAEGGPGALGLLGSPDCPFTRPYWGTTWCSGSWRCRDVCAGTWPTSSRGPPAWLPTCCRRLLNTRPSWSRPRGPQDPCLGLCSLCHPPPLRVKPSCRNLRILDNKCLPSTSPAVGGSMAS